MASDGDEVLRILREQEDATRRCDGAWRIVHEHGSFPTMMDGSGRSATDLKP